jgi:hypothetical protein
MLMKLLIILLAIIGVFLIWFYSHSPSNERNWSEDQKILPDAEFSADRSEVHMKNIRNFEYRTESDYDINHYDKTFKIDQLNSIDFVVTPFSNWKGVAHTMLSFGFDTDGDKISDDYISISVEIRKEVGEEFSPTLGLFRQFELMYVIADERDVIGIRTHFRKNDVHVYPMVSSKEGAKNLFINMLEKVHHLNETPEFYNSITATCNTRIIAHVNRVAPKHIPWSWKWYFPGYSDELAYKVGLINTDLSFKDAREKFKINSKEVSYNDEDFSTKIRK